ncbi:maleylpyruvate isomerase N-terminal domain-containing protein [Phycicoccus endophyticus]|uniref:Maleylpyruvate isomerase N-terminal domain-containing protein n=1 Tax=Phycicoccus endophyticus TaxID=1690220 RepID=A0A7G9QZT0_9MICO|nr:maleylpyruvate isomerase N-terminal domain-containing protein [Phycicoccus endophyticus]NHI20051.1 maleylpyruvate isomerase family mycothiol-dependent enzyme [Phycicoccus endophyticus]QNN48855.1 maleylpyruvate isomerase N-terminal domain-containing protein [Phycicoccus endophyticus]GGL42268.1 hypothetical protein GCM10012283_26120 [Phycicoccus endophyticus]
MTAPVLPLARHLEGLQEATARLATWSLEAGLESPVPPCPGWRVRDLLEHQGMVHRWALAMLRGGDPRVVGIEATAQEAHAAPDPVSWLRAGAAEMLATLRSLPDDAPGSTFLVDAPAARLFWARRQHHETTIHALDALAARTGSAATARDAWFGADVAVDGVDELLVGFWQRPGRGPRAAGAPYRALVETREGARWLLDVGTDSLTTRRLAADETAPAVPTLSGAATDVHLALWNRGGAPDDEAGLLPAWRERGAVR